MGAMLVNAGPVACYTCVRIQPEQIARPKWDYQSVLCMCKWSIYELTRAEQTERNINCVNAFRETNSSSSRPVR